AVGLGHLRVRAGNVEIDRYQGDHDEQTERDGNHQLDQCEAGLPTLNPPWCPAGEMVRAIHKVWAGSAIQEELSARQSSPPGDKDRWNISPRWWRCIGFLRRS